MNFYDWMREKTNLVEKSAKIYTSSINSISKVAKDEKIIKYSIFDITSLKKFNSIVIEIEKLSKFQKKNKDYHRAWSSALKKYGEFLEYLNKK